MHGLFFIYSYTMTSFETKDITYSKDQDNFDRELFWLARNIIVPFSAELNNWKNSLDRKTFWTIPLELDGKYSVPWILDPEKSEKIPYKYFPEWGIKMFYNCRLTQKLWNVVYENALVNYNWITKYETHKETYYSQRKLPWNKLNIPWRHVAKNDKPRTVRDWEWYICVAANHIPKWARVMTTLWPGKVYDALEEPNGIHIDIYVDL